MIVTDVETIKENGEKKVGFYMQGYLAKNLLGVPHFLSKAYDCVGIVSGHGKVRIGKSTLAMQVGYFIAWTLAGGQILMDETEGKLSVKQTISPKKQVAFSLDENVVFSADELQTRAFKLYDKYGKNQVIVYDEGRQGLDSARAMESINKGMEDFFQECGFMGHVIIIVLPNFFKLHEDYAVARSLFLLDVFADKKFNRGYFNFYNELQKERLFHFGKKKIGITAKYSSANESFWGKFTSWFPFDKEAYEELKKKALMKKRRSKQQLKWKKQRDCLIYMLKTHTEMTNVAIAEELSVISGQKISEDIISWVIKNLKGNPEEEAPDNPMEYE